MSPSDTLRWRLDSDESNGDIHYVSSFEERKTDLKNSQHRPVCSFFATYSVFRHEGWTDFHDIPSITAAKPLCNVYSVDRDYDDKENDPYFSSSLFRKSSDVVLLLDEPINEQEGRGYILPHYYECKQFREHT
jgi:hypothetical protein